MASIARSARRHVAFGLTVAALAAIIPWFWISPGTVIAGIDIPPMVNFHVLYLTTLHTWDPAPNGGISNFVGYGMYWPFFVAGMILQKIGATPHLINIGVMSLTFALGALGMYLLARRAGSWAASFLAVAYTLNFAHVFFLPAIGTVIAYSSVPWIPLVVIWASGKNQRQQALIGLLAGLISTGMIFSKINPPTYLTAYVGGFILSIIGLVAARRRAPVPFLIAFSLSYAIFNAWWIFDFLASLKLDPTAVTAPIHVGAVSKDSPLSQVLLLGGSWAFDPAYDKSPFFSYAHWLRRPIIQVLLAMLPLGSLGLLILFSRARGAVIALVSLVVLLILGAGYHPPFNALFLLFLDHFPGGWLYREPLTKVDGLILAVYLMGFVAVLPQLRARRDRVIAYGCLALCCIGSVVGGWPIINGSVIRSPGAGRPGFAVHVPNYWLRFAKWANGQPNGRMVMLPEYGEYQVMYDWGYLGADIDGMLLRHPFIDATPSIGYTDSAVQSAALLWYDNLGRRFAYNFILSRKLADALAIKYAVVRRDVVPSPQSPRLTPETRYLPRLAALGFHWVHTFGKIEVYERRCCLDVRRAYLENAPLVAESSYLPFDVNPDVISPDAVVSHVPAPRLTSQIVYPSRNDVFALAAQRVAGGFELHPIDGFPLQKSDAFPVPVKPGDLAFISVGPDLEELGSGRSFDWISSPGLQSAGGGIITVTTADASRKIASASCTFSQIKAPSGVLVVVKPTLSRQSIVELSENGQVLDSLDTFSGIHPRAVFRVTEPGTLKVTVTDLENPAAPVRFLVTEYRIRRITGWRIRPQGRLMNKVPLPPQPDSVRLDGAHDAKFRMKYPALVRVGLSREPGVVTIWRVAKGGALLEWSGPMGGEVVLGGGTFELSVTGPKTQVGSVPLFSHPFSLARITLHPQIGNISIETNAATETSSMGTYHASRPGLLILREAFSNGWQLKVDGHIIKHLHTAIMENAWIVPAGIHHFRLRFVLERRSNVLLNIAKVAAILVLVLLLGGTLYSRRGLRSLGGIDDGTI